MKEMKLLLLVFSPQEAYSILCSEMGNVCVCDGGGGIIVRGGRGCSTRCSLKPIDII